MRGFPRESLPELAYYFSDHNYTAPYAMNAARMVGRLREKVDRWKDQWAGGPKPELRLVKRDGASFVYDTRSGTTVEHHLGDSESTVA